MPSKVFGIGTKVVNLAQSHTQPVLKKILILEYASYSIL